MQKKLIHPFKIIADENTNILILGSFPSVVSRKENFYYMNKNNRFYKLLSAIYNDDFFNSSIEDKIKLLKKHHIGLSDMIVSCNIINSSDSTIKNETILNVDEIINQYPIKIIICNGKKSYDLLIKHFPHLKYMTYYLPSTSSANASFSLNKLIEIYKELIGKI